MKDGIKNIINIVLLFGVIAVWGIIVYQLFFNASEEGAQDSDFRFTERNANTSKFEFPDNVLDPFYPFYKAKSNNIIIVKKIETEVPAPIPPNMKLLGIIEDRSSFTAILEFDSDSMAYVKEGDEIRGLSIEKITAKKIIYSFFGTKKEILVE